MKITIIGKYEKGNVVPLPHCEEKEINISDINALSSDKNLRLVGVDKEIFRVSLKSYKILKKQNQKVA